MGYLLDDWRESQEKEAMETRAKEQFARFVIPNLGNYHDAIRKLSQSAENVSVGSNARLAPAERNS